MRTALGPGMSLPCGLRTDAGMSLYETSAPLDETVTRSSFLVATPLTSPVRLNNATPAKSPNPAIANPGRPPEIGDGSVTRIFIWTTPPGGAVSLGM